MTTTPLTLIEMINEGMNYEQTCGQCKIYFKKVSHFNRHIRERHESTRSYICEVANCSKSFKRNSHLKRHSISHTHEKTYQCLKCIMSFGYKHHLDRHDKVIHRKELLKCSICQMTFIKKKAYNKHYLKHQKQLSKQQDQINIQEKKTKQIKKAKITKRNRQDDGVTGTRLGQSENGSEFLNEETIKLRSCNSEHAIYHSSEEHDQREDEIQAKSQKEMYRCIHDSCLSAFYEHYELKKHLRQVHKEQP